jgi:hypothetical protein
MTPCGNPARGSFRIKRNMKLFELRGAVLHGRAGDLFAGNPIQENRR